jgi:hypothetical protein
MDITTLSVLNLLLSTLNFLFLFFFYWFLFQTHKSLTL